MLDELLGRAELKERIANLEEEAGHLEARYEAESDRRAEAVRARQEAEEQVNRLQDRIADLEGRLEARSGDEEDVSFRGREVLTRARLRSILARLRSFRTDAEGALTAFVHPDDIPETVESAVGDRSPLVRRAAPCLVCVDDAGLVAVTLDPPAPPEPFAAWSDGFELDDAWFLPRVGDALALVRSDLFVVGTYDRTNAEEWEIVETVESDVKSAHSKGGFSQGRFERRRDAQVDEHVEKSLDALGELDTDRLIVVGEKTVLGAFEDRADRLARVDASGEPEEAFAAAVDDFFTTQLSLL